jgi:hypothetical protein
MKINEITESASVGASCAGGIAPVETALGGVQTRAGGSLLSGKYSTDPTPNTPPEIKRFKKNARGQFKNSISN